MPITQERFLGFIEGFASYIDGFNHIRGLLRQSQAMLADTRAMLERIDDDHVKQLLVDYLALLTLVNDIAVEINNPELEAQALFEQKYFKANFRRNAKQAEYQRRWRFERGVTRTMRPPAQAQAPVADTYDANPSWQPDIAGAAAQAHAERERSAQAKFEEAKRIAREATALTRERLRQEREAQAAQAPSAAPGAKPALVYNAKYDHGAGVSYDPSVLSTSVPSLAELNAKDAIAPGEDVL